MEGHVTVPEAAQRIGISQKSIREHIYAGNLKATKYGRDWFITESDFEEFLKRPRNPGRPPSKSD